MESKLSEKDFQNLLIKEIQKQIERIRIFKRNIGLFRSLDGKRTIRIETCGLPDLYGFYRSDKNRVLHIEIETKTRDGRLSAAQLVFKKFYESWGGIYILARGDYKSDLQKSVNELKFKINDNRS